MAEFDIERREIESGEDADFRAVVANESDEILRGILVHFYLGENPVSHHVLDMPPFFNTNGDSWTEK